MQILAELPEHIRTADKLLTLFAKGERANLSKAERNELAGLVELLVKAWRKRQP